MKKIRFYLISLVLTFSLFTGCDTTDEDTGLNPQDTNATGYADNRDDYINVDNVNLGGPLGGGPIQRNTAFEQNMNGGIGQDKVLATIQFGFDEFTVSGAERAKLDQVVSYMNSNPSSLVVAEGHTDWHGTTEYNLGLGDRRSNAVKDYILRQGIDPSRVEVLSLGELEADPDLPKTHPDVMDDRRVDVILVN